MKPKITVCMPVYNSAPFLKEAIESVLRQAYSSFELIVCDDGSTDASYRIAAGAARSDSRIRLVRNLRNQGEGATRNKIMALARGEYFAIHDSDDVMLAGRLGSQARVLDRNPEIGVVFGHELALRPRKNGASALIGVRARIINAAGIFGINRSGRIHEFPFIAHCSTMFRTALAKEVGGYPENFRIGTDRMLFRKLWGKTVFYGQNRYAYIHRLHENNVTLACRNGGGGFSHRKFAKSLPTPRVTIALPVFNCAQDLTQSLESILRQDYPNFEIIVYSNGSSDSSFAVARRYQKLDPRIRAYGSRIFRGVASVRNRMLKWARGEYVVFQEARDLMLAGRLKMQVKVLDENQHAGIVFARNFAIAEKEGMINAAECRFKQSGFVRPEVEYPESSAMFKKNAILQRGRRGTRLYFVNQFVNVCGFRHENGKATRRLGRKMRQARFDRVKKRFAFNWHGGRVEIFSERSHFLRIVRKNLSYYLRAPRVPEKSAFGKIRIEVHYRHGNEPGIREEINAELLSYLERFYRTYFISPDGTLKIFIQKNRIFSESFLYHSCFLIPLNRMLRRFQAVLLHGALLEKKTGILIIGHSGMGKSTLSGLLSLAGFRYFSDEHVVLRRVHSKVEGLSFANRIGIIPAAAKAHFRQMRHLMTWDGKMGKYYFKPWETGPGVGTTCDVKTLLFPRFVSGARFRARRLSGKEKVDLLMKDEYVAKDSFQRQFHREIFEALSRQADGFSVVYGQHDIGSFIQWILDREEHANG